MGTKIIPNTTIQIAKRIIYLGIYTTPLSQIQLENYPGLYFGAGPVSLRVYGNTKKNMDLK